MVNQAKAWKTIKDFVANIPDSVLRNVYIAEFRKRAVKDWGYNPDSRYGVAKTESVELDQWEQELVKDIKKAESFEVDTRIGKREKTAKEAKVRMLDFISKGGCLKDIPEDIRTDTIVKLYYECLNEYGDQLMAEADRFIGEN